MALKKWHKVLKRDDNGKCNVVCYPIVTRKYHLPYKPEGHNDSNLVDIYDDSARGDLIDAQHTRDLLKLVKYHANKRLYHTTFDYPKAPEPSNNNDDPSAKPIKIDSWDANRVVVKRFDDTKTYWSSGDTHITYKTTSSGTKFAWDYDYATPAEHHLLADKNPNWFMVKYRDTDKYEDPYVSKIIIPNQPAEDTDFITFEKDDDEDDYKTMIALNEDTDVELRGRNLIKLRGYKNGNYYLYGYSNQDPEIEHEIHFFVTYGDKDDLDEDGDPKIKTDKIIKKFKYNPVITDKYIITASYPDRVKSFLKRLGTLSTINYGEFNSGELVYSSDFRNLMEAAIEMSRVCHCVSNYTDSSRNICDCNY